MYPTGDTSEKAEKLGGTGRTVIRDSADHANHQEMTADGIQTSTDMIICASAEP
jgi:hypothetical protein